MMKRFIAVLIVLLLVVPVAVAAEDQSGSMEVEESAVEIFTNTLGTHSGNYHTGDICLGFPTIEYFADLETVVMDFDIRGGSGGPTIHGPTGFEGAHTTDFTAHCDGQIVGSGDISLLQGKYDGQWKMTLMFNYWDVGELTGTKSVVLDYVFGDGTHEKLYSTINVDTNYWGHLADGDSSKIYPVNDGKYLWAWEPPYNTVDVEIHYNKHWINGWKTEEINDISNTLYITKLVGGRAYTSTVTVYTPLNTYELGTDATDTDLITVGRPIYISATDMYSNEYLAISHGEDYCSFAGNVYDVTDGSALVGATVVAKQNDQAVGQLTDTTDSAGAYQYIGVPLKEDTEISTTKTGYTGMPVSFSPPWSQEWVFDLYMYPDGYTPVTPAIGGMVHEGAQQQAISGATVLISNATWSDNTITTSTGYYCFENLTAGDYSINATATSHTDSTLTTVTAVNETFVQHNPRVYGIYPLSVTVKSSETNAPINVTTTVTLSDGQSATTTTGTTSFDVDYGTYTVQATADGYYAGSEYVAVTGEAATVTVFLYPVGTGAGSGYSYPPHQVKFIVRDNWGKPIESVTVTATATETTGLWEWLADWLGLSSAIEIQNTTMTGTTGSDGSIDFMMIEAVKYDVVFTKSGEVDTTWSGYPKDEYYVIYPQLSTSQWFEDGSNPLDVINITATKTANATAATITVYYNDSLVQTTGGTINLDRTCENGTAILTDSYSVPSSDFDHTFNLPGDHRGESYLIQVNITHTTFGDYERSAPVYFSPSPSSFGLPEELLLFIGMGLIFFTAMFFGQSSVPAGAIFISLEAWIFFWFGWWGSLGSDLAVGGVCTFISIVAVLTVIMHRSKRERYA